MKSQRPMPRVNSLLRMAGTSQCGARGQTVAGGASWTSRLQDHRRHLHPERRDKQCFVDVVYDSLASTAMRDSRKFSIVPEEQSKLEPYPFVFVEDDGSVRELHAAERLYLETPFEGADGARPYVKARFDSRDGWGSIAGFCERSLVPHDLPIAAAPLVDPNPPMNAEQHIEWLKTKLKTKSGWTAIEQPDGTVVLRRTKNEDA